MDMMPSPRAIVASVVLTLAAAACAPTAPRAATTAPQMLSSIGTSAVREQTADEQVQHVLSRLTFGARPGDVVRVREMGVDAFIAQQLRPDRIPDQRLKDWLNQFETLDLTYADLQEAYPRPNEALQALGAANRNSLSQADSGARRVVEGLRRVSTQVQTARIGRALLTDRQLDEVMTDFWLNHFSVFGGKNALIRYAIPEYENTTIRPRAMGKFRDLLGAVAKSPAMLYYLDNWQSAADSGRPRLEAPRLAQARNRGLNENYGRELLELHTLGVDGGYTQQDVIDVARALTGWTFLPQQPNANQLRQMAGGAAPGRATARPGARPGAGGRAGSARVQRAIEQRLPEPGVFFFNPQVHDAGEKTVLGHRLRAGRGVADGEEVLDIVARHPATARHIATKLVRRFVSDDPPEELVDRAAAVFTRTDGDIREVVRTIITSGEFFSSAAFRSKVKTPFEVVVSALRALDAQPDPTPRTSQVVAQLGQPIYGRQTPDGWPDVASEWMGTGAILNRINFGLTAGAGRLPGARPLAWPGAQQLVSASRTEQVDAVIQMFLGGRVSPETREILLNGSNPLQQGTARDEDGPIQPARGLAQLVGLAIGAPEFQRR
jgi:uncharacterized protein (DUF1800 family)